MVSKFYNQKVDEPRREQTKRYMTYWFNNHLSAYEIIRQRTNVTLTAIIEDEKSLGQPTGRKKMELLPDAVMVKGDYITFNNISWLVTDDDLDNLVYPRYFIQATNYDLIWTIQSTGEEVSRRVVNESKNPYNPGIKQDREFDLGSQQRAFIVALDEKTNLLERDTKVKIGELVYRLTSIDKDTESNILNLVVTEYQRTQEQEDSTDNNATPDVDISIVLEEGNALELINSTTHQLNYSVIRNGEVVSDVEVEFLSSDESVATVDSNGLISTLALGSTNITVRVKGNENVNQILVLTVASSPSSNIVYRFDSDSKRSLYASTINLLEGESSDYHFDEYDNDNAQSTSFTFEIDYGTLSTDIASVTTIDGNNCSVKTNQDGIFGTIDLVANEGLTERGRLSIEITSL